MNTENYKSVTEYYRIFEKTPLMPDIIITGAIRLLFAPKTTVLVSDNRFLRGVAKIRQLDRQVVQTAIDQSYQVLAFCDAVSLLAKKGVPVFFYNRVGKLKDGYQYRDSEERRMTAGLDFPKMYENPDLYAEDLREIFGELYSPEYVDKIGKIPQVVRIGDRYCHEDFQNEYITVRNGERFVPGQPEVFDKTIHVYGRCGAFGYAVEDAHTLPALLQKELREQGFDNIRVVNHGLWGGSDEYLDHNFMLDSIGMEQGDVVLFYRKHFDKRLMKELVDRGVYYNEINYEWHEKRNDKVTFYNQPGHMNADGYKLVSTIISQDMISHAFKSNPSKKTKGNDATYLNHYLKTTKNAQFNSEVIRYTEDIIKQHPISEGMICGSIVMNCNPFTYGHRYLVKTAAKQVDRLYIFVVEEDKSFFKFKDRYEMVVSGTTDLDNVVVVPSGKFIISAYTFPEYFMKDYVKEKNFDVSMDVETFCKYIAPPLRIKKRFAGEEPFDPVTKNYNENMAKILPEYGMEFVEIPRLALDEQRVINATRVRELLKSKDYKELKEYVPESTYSILMERYC